INNVTMQKVRLRSLAVTAGSGADSVNLDDFRLTSSASFGLGNGQNFLEAAFHQGGSIAGALTVVAGSGNDNVYLGGQGSLTVGGPVSITTGSPIDGGDSLTIENSTFLSALTILTGSGSDFVYLDYEDNSSLIATLPVSIAGKLTVDVGA